LASVFTLVLIVIVAATSFVLPAHDSYRDVAGLGRRTNQICPQHAPVYLFGTFDSELIYYLDRTTVRIDDPASLEAGLPPGSNSVYLVTVADYTRYLEPYGKVAVLDRCASLRKRQPPEQRELLVRLDPRTQRIARKPTE
jgi:hypothetical protein